MRGSCSRGCILRAGDIPPPRGQAPPRDEELWKINVEAIQRIERRLEWAAVRHKVRALPGEPYASDLDIFGHASLFQLLDTLTDLFGRRDTGGVAARPRHARRGAREARRQSPSSRRWSTCATSWSYGAGCRAGSVPTPSGSSMGRERALAGHRPSLRWGAVVSSRRSGYSLYCPRSHSERRDVDGHYLCQPHPSSPSRRGGSSITWWRGRPNRKRGSGTTRQPSRLFAGQLSIRPRSSDAGPLTSDGKDAVAYAGRLNNLSAWVIPASAFLYIPVQVVTMWDVHLLAALERWQIKAGKHARAWLQTLGEFEAICALARLAYDNPTWSTPDVDAAATSLEATDLGHPLLQGNRRVTNDVEVGPTGTFLLVTGSNMSGKSTLLRAIGVNIVLAGAGGPVCASALKVPPVDLWTSMRVEDSLERGVSYYMAELQRLKSVVDAAGWGPRCAGAQALLPARRILQGTNTAERQIAARRVILHLARQGALGAVSTHDLTLAEAPEIAAIARMVHFTETLSNGQSGPAMSFDYKLRPA